MDKQEFTRVSVPELGITLDPVPRAISVAVPGLVALPASFDVGAFQVLPRRQDFGAFWAEGVHGGSALCADAGSPRLLDRLATLARGGMYVSGEAVPGHWDDEFPEILATQAHLWMSATATMPILEAHPKALSTQELDEVSSELSLLQRWRNWEVEDRVRRDARELVPAAAALMGHARALTSDSTEVLDWKEAQSAILALAGGLEAVLLAEDGAPVDPWLDLVEAVPVHP